MGEAGDGDLQQQLHGLVLLDLPPHTAIVRGLQNPHEVHLSTTLEKNVSPQGTESTQSTLVTILAKTDRIQVISMETNMFICHLFTNYAN